MVRRREPGHPRLGEPQQRTPTCSRPRSPATRASSSGPIRPTSSTTRPSSRTSASTTRSSSPAARPRPSQAIQQAVDAEAAAALLLVGPALAQLPGRARPGSPSRPYKVGCDADLEAVECDYPETPLNKFMRTTFTRGRRRRDPHQELQVDERRPEHRLGHHHQPGHDARGGGEEVGRRQRVRLEGLAALAGSTRSDLDAARAPRRTSHVVPAATTAPTDDREKRLHPVNGAATMRSTMARGRRTRAGAEGPSRFRPGANRRIGPCPSSGGRAHPARASSWRST